MPWEPPPSVAVVRAALPPESGTVDTAVAPSKNVTVPVGSPAALAPTVAVRVIGTPKVDGLAEEVTATFVGARLTVSVSTADVAPANGARGVYTAVSASLPAGRLAVISEARPAARPNVPRLATPFQKVTDP